MRAWNLGDGQARRVYLLLAIIFLGLGLRLYRIDAFGWWDGEPHTILHSLHPLMELPRVLRDFAAHPPLWYVVTHLFLYIGSNETLLRFPALLIGVLSIPVIYLLGEHLLGKAEGLLASFLLAISPVAIRWSQSVRMYSAMLLFSVLSLFFLLRALREGKAVFWAGFALSTLLSLYNHYFALFVLFSEVAYAGIVIWEEHQSSREKEQRENEPGIFFSPGRQASSLLATLFLIVVCYLPWLPVMRANFFLRQAERESRAVSGFQLDLPFLKALFGDFSGTYGSGLILFGALFMIGLLTLLIRRRWRQLLLTLLWIGPPLLIVALIAPRRFHAKYILFVLPIYLLLISEGIVALGTEVKGRVEGVHSGWLGGLLGTSTAIICLVALSSLNLGLLHPYFLGESEPFEAATEPLEFGYRADWRGLLTHLEEGTQPGDFVLARSTGAYKFPEALLVYLHLNDDLRSRFSDRTPSRGGYVNVWWIGKAHYLVDFKPLAKPESISSVLQWGNLAMIHTQTQVRFRSPRDRNLGFERDDGTNYGEGDKREGNSVPDGWTVVKGRDRISLDESTAFQGKRSLAIDNTEKADVVMISPPFAVQWKKPVRLTARVKGGVRGYYDFWPSFDLLFFDKSHEQVRSGGTYLPLEGPSLEGWRSIVVQAITPRKAAYARVKIVSGPYLGAYSPRTWIDDLQLQVGKRYKGKRYGNGESQ